MTPPAVAEKDLGLLLQTPLFRGLAAAEVEELLGLGQASYASFQEGDYIYRRQPYERRLGIILAGRAQVTKVGAHGQRIIMNILTEGNLLGGATLFHEFDYYVMEITATTASKLLFLSQGGLERIFQADYRLVRNYIGYLSSRIYFLNRKIDGFTRTDARCRVLNYLADNLVEDQGQFKVCPPYSMKDLAAALNISRATLYRVLDDLIKEGIIYRQKGCIYPLDLGSLTGKDG
ncbi:MAG: Crp/Fnr family transcriptional regulator [Firmicutes bacterium]|nr:Crp/Fnr family transcriptional regulator [Bacillota bacterium]